MEENFKYFIKNIGYELILSTFNDIYSDSNTQDSYSPDIEKCQIFILIIGGHNHNKRLENDDKKIINKEYFDNFLSD